MAATELKEISNSVRGMNQTTGQFRQAATAHNQNLSKIVKDISNVFSSQKGQIAELQQSISESTDSGSKTSSKLDQTNNLLQQSISIQNSILSQMKTMVSYLSKSNLGGGSSSSGAGLGFLGAAGAGAAGAAAGLGAASMMNNIQAEGDNKSILETIKKRESGNDYAAQSKSSSASGAYQFIDSTWGNLTQKFGVGTEYKRAKDAPPQIQDAVADKYVSQILKENNNDVTKVPLVWYTGNAQGKMSEKALAVNKGLSPQSYQQSWMKDYSGQASTGGSQKVGTPQQQAGASSGEKLADQKGKLFNLGGGQTGNESNLQGLSSELQSAVLGALKEYQQATGKTATITSGHRTKEEQQNVGATYGIKAAPGTSNHEKGTAIDISSEDARAMEKLGILSKHGLHRPMGERDPVHIELAKGGSSTMGLDQKTAALMTGEPSGQGKGLGMGGQMMPMGMPMPMMSPMMMGGMGLGRGAGTAALIGGLAGAFAPLLGSLGSSEKQSIPQSEPTKSKFEPSYATPGSSEDTAANFFAAEKVQKAKLIQEKAAEDTIRQQQADEATAKKQEPPKQSESSQPQKTTGSSTPYKPDEEMFGKGDWAGDILRYFGVKNSIA